MVKGIAIFSQSLKALVLSTVTEHVPQDMIMTEIVDRFRKG